MAPKKKAKKKPKKKAEPATRKKPEELDRELLFAREFTNPKNKRIGKRAAIAAGYAPKSAESKASQLLRLVKVQDEIARLEKMREGRLEITKDKIEQELARLAFSNIKDYLTFDKTGVTLKNAEDMTPEQLKCIAEVSETVTEHGGTTRFKLYDKRAALVDLGRNRGMFKDKTLDEIEKLVFVLKG